MNRKILLKTPIENLGTDGVITLKGIFKKGVMKWTGFTWFRI
jgi:hypothetical protein